MKICPHFYFNRALGEGYHELSASHANPLDEVFSILVELFELQVN